MRLQHGKWEVGETYAFPHEIEISRLAGRTTHAWDAVRQNNEGKQDQIPHRSVLPVQKLSNPGRPIGELTSTRTDFSAKSGRHAD